MRYLRGLVIGISLFAFIPCTSALGQTYKDRYGTTNNGINRGYVGSDSWSKKQMEAAQRRQLTKKSLEKNGGSKATSTTKSKSPGNTAGKSSKPKPVRPRSLINQPVQNP